MKDHRSNGNHGEVSGWEDDGGAGGADAAPVSGQGAVAPDGHRSQQERLDATYQSGTRGEHRYSDVHQTETEQQARQARDDLKQRLAGWRRQP